MEKQGHTVKIAYGRGTVPKPFQKFAVRIGSKMGVRINGVKARLFDNEGFNAKLSTRKFLKWAEEYGPDLLWLHNLHGYYINIDLLFGWIKSRPKMKVKWLLHDCWAFTGHCAHFTIAKCEKWNVQCMNCCQKNKYPKSFFRDNSKGNFIKKREIFTDLPNLIIITPSQWLADLVRKSFLGKYPIQVQHNTIDKDVFRPVSSDFRKEYHLNDKKIILGVASAWGKEKGLDDFIKLSTMLDDSYVIVLVGLTRKQIKKIPKAIVCISRTNNVGKLVEIYSAADVYVNASRQETFGMTTLEALSCGTECIVYENTACEEVAKKYGGIVVRQDPGAVYEVIQKRFGKANDHE